MEKEKVQHIDKFHYKSKARLVKMPTEVKVPANASDMLVVTKVKNLVRYVYQITEKSPKKFRFTLVGKLQNLCLECIDNLYRANEVFTRDISVSSYEKRYDFQSKAMTNIKLLEYVAMLAKENECILMKQYEQIAKQGAECIILLANWIESDKKRFMQNR